MTGSERKTMPLWLPAALFTLPMVVSVGLCWHSGFWLPDLLAPRADHVLGRCAVGSGESVELIQRWAGDGYLTGVRHRLADGTCLFAAGDGDARRAFRSSVVVMTNLSCVEFQFSGRPWRYFWSLRSLSTETGSTRDAQ